MLADAFRQLLERTRGDGARQAARRPSPSAPRASPTPSIPTARATGPFTLRFALTRTPDDRFILDATETDDQAPGPVNLLMHPDVPGMALGLYFLQGEPGQVLNAGAPRAIDEVILREGSLLPPRSPAPLGLRGLTMMRLLAACHGLVAVARQGEAPAAHSAYVVIALRGTADTGKPFLMTDGVGVGYGARPFADGTDAVYFVAQENYPVGVPGARYPVRLRSYAINRDSGGAGPLARRLRRRARVRGAGRARRCSPCASTACATRPGAWPAGMNGGSGRAVVNPGTPQERVLPPLRTAPSWRAATCCGSRPAAAAAGATPSTASRSTCWRMCAAASSAPRPRARDYGVVLARRRAWTRRRRSACAPTGPPPQGCSIAASMPMSID